MSLPINEVVATLRDLKLPADIIIRIENELEAKEAEKKEESAANGPKAKNEFVTILLDPEDKLKDAGDFTSLIVQIPEGQDAGKTLDLIYKSVYDQQAAAKRKFKKISTLGEAADGVKRKFLKENNVNIKTKIPVRVLISDNKIPAA